MGSSARHPRYPSTTISSPSLGCKKVALSGTIKQRGHAMMRDSYPELRATDRQSSIEEIIMRSNQLLAALLASSALLATMPSVAADGDGLQSTVYLAQAHPPTAQAAPQAGSDAPSLGSTLRALTPSTAWLSMAPRNDMALNVPGNPAFGRMASK